MNNVTLENIISQTSCPPLSLNDFRKFLTYIEYSVENLDFYLWYRSYQLRFNQLPTDVIEMLTPCKIPHENAKLSKLYQMQPFRDEIDAVIERFFSSNSMSELNVEVSTREKLLAEAVYTTHPSIFHAAAMEAYHLMEGDSFVRFKSEAIKNLSPATIHFRCIFGVILMILAFLGVSMTILLHQGRWMRLVLTPLILVGISYLLSSYRGICAAKVYARMREIKPYESFPLSNTDISTCLEKGYSTVDVVNSAIIQEQKRILLLAFFQIVLLSVLVMLLILLVPVSLS
ncbi:hypothetical protein K493DRAFT_231086 [Basidiobolus meristosporus CBS 931.73]|uniref:RGS domain-containing protein n=1 Tax=Basidiobolus meristosporus CBS 931.73 TaxID=1314790 RepID=A0A1Y1XWV2_9FUNG|nr:hypothetical protein K493DRAFT_231086 [Basidiobolus meristosporus CBS 931.73]|eukprot:ORX90237.1 hypothetical protein K493DRAFT_231086 [Basidiobolus meristosporus CBS 931.73]